ncbi:MAG: hypothetical protein ACXWW0_06455 [Bacteroidia bacterium]
MRSIVFTKSLAFILLLVVADVILVSCYKSKTYKYQYSRVLLEVMNAESAASERYLGIDGDSVNVQNMFFDVHLVSDIIAKANIAPSLFLSPAMAFQPNKDYYINTSRLKSIKILSLSNYNDSLPAGSDITGKCTFGFGNRYAAGAFTAAEFIEKYNTFIKENEKILAPHIPSQMFWFRVKANPHIPSSQKMLIAIELEEGKTLQAESITFRINR